MKEYKSSDTFKQTKKELQDKGLTSYTQDSILGILKSYAASSTPTDKWVNGSTTLNCGSKIPCYTQFKFNYSSGECHTGCVPTAIAMIYGYYDRQGTFPNLVTGTAVDYITNSSGSNTNITTMVNTIRGYVQTTCGPVPILVGSTTVGNIALGIQYAKDKGYFNSTATTQTSSRSVLHQSIKNQIDIHKPVLVGIQGTTSGHAIVAWGYSTTSDSKMIRVNYGWGKDSRLYDVGTNPRTASVDVNIDSLTINNSTTNTGTITSITRFNIAP